MGRLVRVTLLGALVGLPVGLVAFCFIWLVHELEHQLWPAVFIGVAVADVGVVAFGMSPTVAIAIGTAAGTAAMTRLLVSSVLFAGLLVGRAGLETIPVVTIAAVAAWLASAGLDGALARRQAQGSDGDRGPAAELP